MARLQDRKGIPKEGLDTELGFLHRFYSRTALDVRVYSTQFSSLRKYFLSCYSYEWTELNLVYQWRYLLLVGLFASELFLAVGYDSIPIFSVLLPHRVPFQHIRFLHQMFMFLSVALSRVIPVLFPEPSSINSADPRTYTPYLDRLVLLGKAADRERTYSFQHY